MILIYNLSGFLIGLAGIVCGLVVALASGKIAAGVLALAVTWFSLGVWWRVKRADSGLKHPYPALFFIPLPFLAVPLALLAIPMFFAEQGGASRSADPRVASLRADVKSLDAARIGGEPERSERVIRAVATLGMAGTVNTNVFTRSKPGSVLVLVKVPELKEVKEPERVKLLAAIAEAAQDDKGGRVFVGIRGRLAFGAIRVGAETIETGSIVDDSPLLDFYGERPVEAPKG